jgi:hypothetical protein
VIKKIAPIIAKARKSSPNTERRLAVLSVTGTGNEELLVRESA